MRLPGFLVPEHRLGSFGAAEEVVRGLGFDAGLECFAVVDILLGLRLLRFPAYLFSWPTLRPASELRFQLNLNMKRTWQLLLHSHIFLMMAWSSS